MDLVDRVHDFAVRHQLWTSGTPVIAAVSGGADSVALVLVLHELARRGLVRLHGIAHLHHHIRGEAADEDATFVARLAERLRLPLELAHEDVPARARHGPQSLEVAARHARMAFFERLGAQPGRPVVGVAHTRSDQAETVLLRLTRGAGARGLSGMAPRTGHRIRPLLDVGREELRGWLIGRGESWREDETNQDLAIARNLVRHEVMPRLTRINPAAEAALARAARIQAADAAWMDDLSAGAAARLLQVAGGTVRLDLAALRRLPEALARKVVRRALTVVAPWRIPSWDETERVLWPLGPPANLGHVRVELFGETVVLSNRAHRPRSPVASPGPAVTLTLQVPGAVRHPLGWWEIEAAGPTILPPVAVPARGSEPLQAVLDAAALGRHLTIRGWQPGDRVQPLGLGGRKKLQDVFVDRKVPRDERSRVPVVVDAQGRIAWVAGHVVGEPFRVTRRSEAVVVLTLRH